MIWRNQGPLLTVAAVWLGVLSSGWTQRGDPLSFIRLLCTWSRRLRLVGERHDGGGGIGSGGHVLGVGEAVQVLVGGIYGAVDGTLGGATQAVFLRLVQVVGDTGICRGCGCCLVERILLKRYLRSPGQTDRCSISLWCPGWWGSSSQPLYPHEPG